MFYPEESISHIIPATRNEMVVRCDAAGAIILDPVVAYGMTEYGFVGPLTTNHDGTTDFADVGFLYHPDAVGIDYAPLLAELGVSSQQYDEGLPEELRFAAIRAARKAQR